MPPLIFSENEQWFFDRIFKSNLFKLNASIKLIISQKSLTPLQGEKSGMRHPAQAYLLRIAFLVGPLNSQFDQFECSLQKEGPPTPGIIVVLMEIRLMSFVYSMDRRSKRELRHNASCAPFPNIFKNENYILNSGCQFLPEDIYNKVSRFQSITCDDINSLTFVRSEPHEHILHRMNEAFNAQNKMINQSHNFQPRGPWRQDRDPIENDLHDFRMIKSEEEEHFGEEEILKLPCFKSQLANLFIS